MAPEQLMSEVTFAEAGGSLPELGPLLDGELLPEPKAPVPIRRISYTHDAMIDAIIANPSIAQRDLARLFGYTESWISQVINSDAFQAKLHARKVEIVTPALLESVEKQYEGILGRALELTREKLDRPEVPDNFVLRTLEISSRALGYGGDKGGDRPDPSKAVEKLADLSNNLVGLLRKQRSAVTIDMEDT